MLSPHFLGPDSGKLTVTDLGSTNGTTLDGNDLKPQEPAVVAVGSQISFGAPRPRRRDT